jgi:hypothetical protein
MLFGVVFCLPEASTVNIDSSCPPDDTFCRQLSLDIRVVLLDGLSHVDAAGLHIKAALTPELTSPYQVATIGDDSGPQTNWGQHRRSPWPLSSRNSSYRGSFPAYSTFFLCPTSSHVHHPRPPQQSILHGI